MIQLFPETNLINFRKAIPLVLFFIAFVFISAGSNAQTKVVTDSPFIKGTTVVIPGPEFKKSSYHNLWMGTHYRKEWTTPVRVQNFYLDTAMGGLTPTEESGSRQSQGLRLKNKNGTEYVLRSVDKDFGRAFPDNFQGTFITHIAKDEASIAYPFAAITITPMIRAAGIYHTNPKMVFVPAQGPLGGYNKKYGNQLYLFEERPDGNQEGADYFGSSKNLIGSEKLFEHIYEDNDNRVDQKAFAKARLFDMFIGDWGRHPDNWRWAKFEDGKKNIYRPVPRDRDQSYTRFDGFWPWVATNIAGATQLESFNDKLHNPKRFNKPGWPLDRPFTDELTEDDWIKASEGLKRALTDSVIEYGVHQLPPEQFSISGNTIIAKLKSRRDQLTDDAKSYYRFLSHHVEVRGSNEKEFFEIKRLNEKETQVNIYKISNKNEIKDKPYYSRTFKNDETREIRLYSLGKADIIKVTGPPHGVKVRIIDPAATDSISIESRGRTKLSVGKKFRFDSLHTKKFDFFFLPFFSPPEYKAFEDDPMALFTRTGIRISANARYLPQPWREPKYMHSHVISANYGFLRTASNIGYVGRFGHAVGPFDFLIKARVDPVAIENYFGTGNETLDTNTKLNFYRTFTTRIYGGLGLSTKIGKHQSLDISGFYQNIKVLNHPGHFNTVDHGIDSSLFDKNQFGGVEAGYHFRKTNHDIFPTAGIDFSLAADYMKNLDETSRSFTNVVSALSVYIPLGRSFTLASRAGGAALMGDADFYHLNKLGGYVNLRGYDRERFSGKTIFYNNNELRWVTNTRNYFFNGKIGLLAFYDQGRVWQPLEKSNKWHMGYGGGVILIPFDKIALTATYSNSEDGNFLQLKAGMFF
ncbi:MAG TPA: BamA/TamA family outer membrane protein [Chitinophagaceae bacterium]|nr:BamA/TamA family outer membrane protein [Chitinophagaceae bacterium]